MSTKTKRVGFILKVKESMIEEYKKEHTAVWPEMLDALRQTGWHNYSLFLRKDGLLFGYFETPHDSIEAAQAAMAATEVCWSFHSLPDLGGVELLRLLLKKKRSIRVGNRRCQVISRYLKEHIRIRCSFNSKKFSILIKGQRS